MLETITSLQNEKIKQIIKLQKAGNRKKNNLIIIEGEREIYLAIKAGVKISEFYYCAEFAKNNYNIINEISGEMTNAVSKEVFQKIAYREHPDGYLALAEPLYKKLAELELSANPLLIVLENVEKPGNIGAIMRTADAAGADAVLVCNTQTDIYNPNVIRASQGTIFTKQIVVCSNQEAIKWLREKNIKTYATALTAKKFYTEMDFTLACAIVMGTEDKGLSSEWLEQVDEEIKIPMLGEIDSLNVSNSAAIVVYEVLRQRG